MRIAVAMAIGLVSILPMIDSIFNPGTAKAAPSPVSYWTLNEVTGTREDSIGERDLTPTGMVGSTTGQIGNAATISGAGQYLSAADHSSLSSGNETSFSISLWVNLAQKSGTQVFVSKYAGSSGEYAVYYEHSFKRFVFSTYSAGQNQYALANTLGEPATDTWYHITAVHDAAANTNAIIVNGGTPTTISSVLEPADTSAAFMIGAFGAGALFPAYASIDDVKFFQSALTQDDAEDLQQVPSNDFAAYWKLDEGSGSTAIDSSGNGRNGTLTNVAYSADVPSSVEFEDPYSAQFNSGSSGRIISTPLSLNNYSEFTMAGWIYPTTSGSRVSLFGQNDIFEFGFADNDTIICYTPKGEVMWDFTPGTFLNNWHHITCLATPYDLIMYIDGQNVASAAISSGSFGSSNDTFSIGAGVMDGGNAGAFTGNIDDVRVYSRGLTPNEMNALGTGSIGPTNGPSVAIASPDDGAAINTWSPSIDWDNADVCEYKFGESSWQAADCSLDGGDIPQPTEGNDITLSIQAYFNDIENPGAASSSFDFDQTAPTVDTGDNIQTNASFSFDSATASDDLSGIATYAWQKQSGPGTVSFSDANILQPTVTSISHDGTYTLRLTVTDQAGNSTYDDITIIWDTTDPDIELTSFPDAITNNQSAVFEFLAQDTLSEPVSYACKIDNESFNSCSSPKQYTNLAEGEHSVTIRGTDTAGNAGETATYNWIIDTTPPEITLNGESTVNLIQGTAYNEAGATANDNISNDLTSDIQINSSVNNSVPGTYTVTYDVTDQAGNNAAQAVRTVRVISSDDLNNDGTPDEIQPNVSGLVNEVSGTVAAIELSSDCTLVTDTIVQESELSTADSAYDYTQGLFDFSAQCSAASTTVRLYYYGLVEDNLVLRKHNPQTGAYFNLTTDHDAIIERSTINGLTVTVASYTIIDGGELDMDAKTDGNITDPAGLASLQIGSPRTGLRQNNLTSLFSSGDQPLAN
jgi:hypothetical protein